MKPERAIEELESLKLDAATLNISLQDGDVDAWDRKVRVVLVATFGETDNFIAQHDSITYSPSFAIAGDDTLFINALRSGIQNCCNLIDAAIYRLQLEQDNVDQRPDSIDYDPKLWAHVSALIERQEWDSIPAQVSIFVEHTIRDWSNNPIGKNGDLLVGKALMARTFGDYGILKLGQQSNENEGWRNLAIGFTQAVSNVARHRLSDRDDARRYAIGVIGLASLLLTQIRYEHGDILKES